MDTYSVFVQFRKDRLALRRKIATLDDAIACAEAHQTTRRDRPDDVFVVVDATGAVMTVAAARVALVEERRVRQLERLERARTAAARTTERASRARERAIVACERARTVSARTPTPLGIVSGLDLDRLIELTDRAAAGMMRSIALMEERLASTGWRSSSPRGGTEPRQPGVDTKDH